MSIIAKQPSATVDTVEGATRFAKLMCLFSGISLARLKDVHIENGALPGKTMLETIFDPELTSEEQRRMNLTIRMYAAAVGASQPIFLSNKGKN